MTEICERDTVALRYQRGRWPAGTPGVVLECVAGEEALIKLVGHDGHSLDMLTVPFTELDLVQPCRFPIGPDLDRNAT